ncbi:MAG: undecaprenyldiphospho-muramoylpentapeptide beta-N-acetylglucosaminyltransferase [Deltaproteobacteria bacterium]|nr:undecaprenyldiphospho-muramoylpentapeptide beta-N-acetylglucosaminyltransferase [Deltaproteobacteria bacterium]
MISGGQSFGYWDTSQYLGKEIRDLKLKPNNEVRGIIAGGGTGGHLFPGVAIAREICRRYQRASMLFVTGRRKMETEILTRSGFCQTSIVVEGLKGMGWKKRTIALLKLPLSFFQSISIIKRFSPHLVLGVGGYSAGPVCLAARLMGIPTAIHEQNSFPGLTNRILCRIVDRVFISFEESRKYFPGGSLYLTGNPLREELLIEKKPDDKGNKKITILVVGGSQGARAINKAFVAALEILKNKGEDPLSIHQTGETDYSQVVEAYRQRGLKGDIMPFIQDMAEAYHLADIVVSRAGATTVSELAALGKPSILIPYPHAANRHQEINARMLVQAGGAEMMLQEDLSGEGLAGILMKYMNNRRDLREMGAQAQKMGQGDAAKDIVNQLVDMIK